jgi:hypothetical protein
MIDLSQKFHPVAFVFPIWSPQTHLGLLLFISGPVIRLWGSCVCLGAEFRLDHVSYTHAEFPPLGFGVEPEAHRNSLPRDLFLCASKA